VKLAQVSPFQSIVEALDLISRRDKPRPTYQAINIMLVQRNADTAVAEN